MQLHAPGADLLVMTNAGKVLSHRLPTAKNVQLSVGFCVLHNAKWIVRCI